MPLFFFTTLLAAFLIPTVQPRTATELRFEPPARLKDSTVPPQDPAFIESLRKDVAAHPGDFLIFGNQGSAEIFMLTHAEVLPETDRRVVQRGIKGYWRGKTLVVLPHLSN